MTTEQAVISLQAVSRTFPGTPAVTALQPCDLEIHAGDFVGVIGPSGSGKSTLLNIVGLLDRPTSGSIRLRGEEVGSLDERARAAIRGRRIGFVFQSFQLLDHRTSLENVLLGILYRGGRRTADEDRARAALSSMGLGDKADTRTGVLSGGERQRVAIARAIVGEPDLLLCDEPTGNLDSAAAVAVLGTLERLNRTGSTIVLITHDAAVAARASRRIRIRDGWATDADDDRRDRVAAGR
jgi:putative ABC transport system ATP-binding protein